MSVSVRGAGSAIEVVRARERDLVALSCLVAAACQDLPPYEWLIDDPRARRQILPEYFYLVLRRSYQHGEVHTTSDAAGVAVWRPATPGRPPTLIDERARLAKITGRWAERFLLRQALLDNVVPAPGRARLLLLAVDPTCRNQGVGTALLQHQHQRLDQAGISAFTSADAHDHDWYRRHGYTDTPVCCEPGEQAPRLYPMYRHPHTHNQAECDRNSALAPLAVATA